MKDYKEYSEVKRTTLNNINYIKNNELEVIKENKEEYLKMLSLLTYGCTFENALLSLFVNKENDAYKGKLMAGELSIYPKDVIDKYVPKFAKGDKRFIIAEHDFYKQNPGYKSSGLTSKDLVEALSYSDEFNLVYTDDKTKYKDGLDYDKESNTLYINKNLEDLSLKIMDILIYILTKQPYCFVRYNKFISKSAIYMLLFKYRINPNDTSFLDMHKSFFDSKTLEETARCVTTAAYLYQLMAERINYGRSIIKFKEKNADYEK